MPSWLHLPQHACDGPLTVNHLYPLTKRIMTVNTNMQAIAEQMRQQLLDAAHEQYQGMVKTINAMFGVQEPDFSQDTSEGSEGEISDGQ